MKFKNIFIGVILLGLFVVGQSFAVENKLALEDEYTQINILLEKNEFQNADNIIKDLSVKNPSDIELKLLSAISLTMQDKLDSAQDILDTVKQSALGYDDLYYGQGAIYLKRVDSSDMRFRNKNDVLLQLAINQLLYGLKINPENEKIYNALGVAELKREDLFKAQQYFEKAIKVSPKYSTALDNLGSIYYIENEIDKAESYFKRAESLNSNSATVYYHLAQVMQKKDAPQKALYYANKSLLMSVNSTYAQNLIGEIYKKQGNEAAAITSFKKAIFVMPENTKAYINLASIYEARGDVDAAVEELKTCHSLTPENDTIKLAIADLVYSIGKYEDAVKYYLMVSDAYKAESIQGIAASYYALATESASKSIFASKKKLKESLIYINKAISENPNNLELYLTKAKLTKLINNQVESKDALLKIVSAPNLNISDLITKGNAFISLGQYKDAKNIYTQIIKMEKPVESDLYLAEYFIYNKQYTLAKTTLEKILSTNPENCDATDNISFINSTLKASEQNYVNAKYFQKRHDRFFQKVYLNKALNQNPNHIDANIMISELYKKEDKLCCANKCLKVALAESSNERQIKKLSNESNKLEKKIAKIEAKKAKSELKVKSSKDALKSDKNIELINNEKPVLKEKMN